MITETESKSLIEWFKNHKHLRQIGSGEDYRGIDLIHIHTNWVRDIFNRVGHDVTSEIYHAVGTRVYPEMAAVNEWEIGGVQEPHLDTYSTVEIENNSIEESPSREWTVILYLNGHESFRGGETYFPEMGPTGTVIEPVANEGIVFKGLELKHGVYPVRRGSRYTISMWFSNNRENILTDERTRDFSADHYKLRQINP